ncbi:tRNA-specific adenosine deaminase [compost metagenome]
MDMDRYFLEIALEEAEIAFSEGTVPIGAVLVDHEGNILSKGRNRIFTANDPTCHAEIDVIRKAGSKLLDPTYK